jgi:hypothetical protein
MITITIFCDFCQFAMKKNWHFSQKPNVMITFLQKLAIVWEKTPIFRQLFWRIYFKKFKTSVPDWTNFCLLGRCYDHNFLRFLTNFRWKKLAFFSKTNVLITFLQKLAIILVKNGNFSPIFFGECILKFKTSVPDWANFRLLGDSLLWVVFVRISRQVSQIIWLLFPQQKWIFTKNGLGYISGIASGHPD